MKLITFAVLVVATFASGCSGMFEKSVETKPTASAQTFHTFRVADLSGKDADLAQWRGKVVLVVNTASECGFTTQYKGLQALHERFAARGFTVVGFPCNDFGGQEPGSAAEIGAFCEANYGVKFPLMQKVQVKEGEGQAPLYKWLGEATGKLPKWNFGKYLIGKDGVPIEFWPSNTTPDDAQLVAAVEKALAAK